MIPWVIAGLLFIGLLALNVAFVISARAIRRDVTRRFDELERRLERHATDLVNHLFNANQS
jgi:hypothetical protein